MDVTEIMEMLLEGVKNNYILTLCSSIVPLGIGILLCIFASKNQTIGKIFGWISVPFECIVPVVAMMYYYYYYGWEFFDSLQLSSQLQQDLFCSIALAMSFLGYMPARYNSHFSCLKNILYNGLGLLSNMFKWSLCGYTIGHAGLLYYSNAIRSATYRMDHLLWVMLLSFISVLSLEMGRRIIKQFMK